MSSTALPGTDPVANGATLSGKVMGGEQPVSGATISVYATSQLGYNQPPTYLGGAVTDSGGGFTLNAANLKAACPATTPASYVYALVTGGNPGLPAGTNNQAIMLAAAYGPCSSISQSAYITINEVTTVATAYALAGFFPSGGSGITYASVSGGPNTQGTTGGISTTTTNYKGMTDAFANAANIVQISGGYAYSKTPAANSNGVVPTALINTLASIVSLCVNQANAASGNCPNLFAYATPPGSNSIAPTNTLQALIDIAQYPGQNVNSIFNQLTGTPAFMPVLGQAPNDWTLGITYTTSDIQSPLGVTVDAQDNVYVLGSTNASVVELSPQGTKLSGTGGLIPNYTTATNAFHTGAFDGSNSATGGNLWLADTGAAGVVKYVPGTGIATTQSYAASDPNLAAGTWALGFDVNSNLFTSSYNSTASCGSGTGMLCAFVEYAAPATTGTDKFGPNSTVFAQSGIGGARGIAVNPLSDTNKGAGDIWATDYLTNDVSVFRPLKTGGPAVIQFSVGNTGSGTYGVALDSSGNGWIVGNAQNALFEVTETRLNGNGTAPSSLMSPTLNGPTYDVFDGLGNLFIINSTPATTTQYVNSFAEYQPLLANQPNAGFLAPNTGFAPNTVYNPAASTSGNVTTPAGPSGPTTNTINNPVGIAIDRSGSLWIVSAGSTAGTTTPAQPSNVVQVLGIAAPVNPVLAGSGNGLATQP